MRNLFTKIAVVAAGVLLLSSCKKDDDSLSNISLTRKDAAQAQVIDQSDMNTDMVLEDRVNGVDYMITHNLQVNAKLTIKPGVTLMFEDGAGLQINATGTLVAIGADGNEILFTSKAGKRGAWRGVTVLSNSNKNVLEYCKIEQGGSENEYGTANVIVGSTTNTAQIEISNSQISTSAEYGISVAEGSKLIGFVGNNISPNSSFPLNVFIADAQMLDNGNTMGNNGKEYIRLYGKGDQSITKAIVLKKLDQAYMISGKVVSANSFTVLPGARVFMDYDAEVIIDGTQTGTSFFSAVGYSAQPIIISSVYGEQGAWKNIRFVSSTSSNNRIEFCNIIGGGVDAVNTGMLNITSGSNVVIRHNTISNSAANGIYISRSSTYNNDITTTNTFANNAGGNVQIVQ